MSRQRIVANRCENIWFGSRFFNRRALAWNIELGAQRHKSVVPTFDNRGQSCARFRSVGPQGLHHVDSGGSGCRQHRRYYRGGQEYDR